MRGSGWLNLRNKWPVQNLGDGYLERTRLRANRSLHFAFLVVAVFGFSNGQVSGQTTVQMSFSDQAQQTNRRNVVLASSTTQESDFAPKKDQTPKTPQKDDTPKPLEFENSNGTNDGLPDAKSTSELSNKQIPTDQLDSDAPVDPPEFKLTDDEPSKEPSAQNDSATEPKSGEPVVNDGYRLPVIADVRMPIMSTPLANVRQEDPSGLLTQDQNVNTDQRYINQTTRYSEISNVPPQVKFKTWQAHDFYHRPLYFEDQNLERAGNRRAFQNAASAAKFFATIPTLPYKLGEQPPNQRVYTFGNGRPGDLIDYRINRYSGNQKGNRLQTLIMLGIILP